jgi:hypothetical protein
VTHLRQIMLEELHRRNYVESTIRTYIRTVEHFSQHFHRPPDQLGPEHKAGDRNLRFFEHPLDLGLEDLTFSVDLDVLTAELRQNDFWKRDRRISAINARSLARNLSLALRCSGVACFLMTHPVRTTSWNSRSNTSGLEKPTASISSETFFHESLPKASFICSRLYMDTSSRMWSEKTTTAA